MTNTLTRSEKHVLAAQEDIINRGLKTFIDVGNALANIRDNRLYREEYKTFEDYCRERWGFNRDYANKQIRAAATVTNLDTTVSKSNLPTTERQARPLTLLEPEQQVEAWQQAVNTAPNGRVTAKHVEQTVKSIFTPKVYQNRESHTSEPLGRDYCQSPPYAILPLLPHLPAGSLIWEPARGEGILENALRQAGHQVISSCILTGQNFFTYQPDSWDIIVTNPPWSQSDKWIGRCFALGRPFALLLKTGIASNSNIQRLNQRYGDFEFVYPESRIDFKMPQIGWEATGAPFNTHWYTWGLNIGKPFSYLGEMRQAKKEFKYNV